MSNPKPDQQASAKSQLHKEDLASLSVRRPVLALVISLLIVLAGLAALQQIEIRELPDVDRPVVSVRGNMPGASPETVDAEVTSKVEGAMSRVAGIVNIRSSSEENNFRIHAEFSPTVNLEQAASDVREAVSRVERQLPEAVENLTVIKAEEDADPIINIAVTSQTLDKQSLTFRIEKDILPELMSVPGVADTPLAGESERVLRVVIDPLRLSSFGLSVNDVITSLETAPLDIPSGSFRSIDQELLVRVDASTITEQQLREVIISDTTRIGDIAQVFFGPANVSSLVYFNGEPVISIGIVRQASSNTIDISERVNKIIERLNTSNDDINLTVIEDASVFIKGSVKEVITSLFYAMMIVVLIIWLFFKKPGITLIPCITIPVSLVGTLACIYLMGFSINILTLLALVLATGLVVDDAIVVLENIQRCRSNGMKPRAASVIGTRQVIFAVLATTAVLISVFIPIGLMPSTTGQMLREFGFALAAAVAISSFVALTLVPALSVHLAGNKKDKSSKDNSQALQGKAETLEEESQGLITRLYDLTLAVALKQPLITLLMAFAFAALATWLYPKLDQELIPSEDRGLLYIDATGPDGVGLDYMQRQAAQMEEILTPLVDNGEAIGLVTTVGQWDPNRVRILVPLRPWEQRDIKQQDIAANIEPPLSMIPGATTRVRGPNSLNIRGGGNNIKVGLTGGEYAAIYQASLDFSDAIEDKLPKLKNPRISYRPTQPQLSIAIDRQRASSLGIPLQNIANTLKVAVDGLDVTDLSIQDESVPLMLETRAGQVNSPDDLANLYVATNNGQLLPLSSVISFQEESVAAELDRHAQRRAIEVNASLEPGYSLASAVADLEQLADEILPDGIELILLGEAQRLDETSRDVSLTYLFALLVVFLVLCAQFESFTNAFIVLFTIPFGLVAAIFALYLTGTSVNLFSQIGLILLIGLMAKNGILVVEFANQLLDEGLNIKQAISKAASIRLRPIMLTILSTVLGGLPLILSSGPGAEARNAIGWVIFGGLGIAALFTLYLTPVFYLLLGRFQKARSHQGKLLAGELEDAS